MEIDRLFGLPAHPLLVHIPVVLIPTALLATLLALWPPLRRAAVITAAVLAAVGAVGAVLAVGAGEKLEERVREEALVEHHAEQGDKVEFPAIAFGILAIGAAAAVEAVHRSRTRGTDDGPASTSRRLPAGASPAGTTDGPEGPVPTAPGTVATAVRAPARPSASTTPSAAGARPPAARLAPVLLALSLLVGAYTTYTVVQAGHSGADATWHDTGDARPGGDAPPSGDVDADGD
jgi:hypothetical protein